MRPDLSEYCRIIVTGGPRSGKTTWVNNQSWDRPVFHLDDHITDDWRADVYYWLGRLRPLRSYVAEGVKGAYLLAKGLPVDLVIRCWLHHPETSRQRSLGIAEARKFIKWQDLHPDVPVHVPRCFY